MRTTGQRPWKQPHHFGNRPDPSRIADLELIVGEKVNVLADWATKNNIKHEIYGAAKATKAGSGDAPLGATKGQVFGSPRGAMYIDAQTPDLVHNVHVRRVEKKDGQLWSMEIHAVTDVKDIGKSK